MDEPAREGLAMARETGDPTLISAGLDAAQVPEWNAGRHRRAVELGRERLELIDANPSSPTLDVERSDALHMMVESLLQTGAFREAADVRRRGAGGSTSSGGSPTRPGSARCSPPSTSASGSWCSRASPVPRGVGGGRQAAAGGDGRGARLGRRDPRLPRRRGRRRGVVRLRRAGRSRHLGADPRDPDLARRRRPPPRPRISAAAERLAEHRDEELLVADRLPPCPGRGVRPRRTSRDRRRRSRWASEFVGDNRYARGAAGAGGGHSPRRRGSAAGLAASASRRSSAPTRPPAAAG